MKYAAYMVMQYTSSRGPRCLQNAEAAIHIQVRCTISGGAMPKKGRAALHTHIGKGKKENPLVTERKGAEH